MPPETFGRNRPTWVLETAKTRMETEFRSAKPRIYRAIPDTGKSHQSGATGWWAMQGSNLRPLPCEGSALPLS
jgi:hypothetical protein